MKGARQMPGVLVKMPQEVKDRLVESAQRRFRSLNAEINARLVESLDIAKEKAPNA